MTRRLATLTCSVLLLLSCRPPVSPSKGPPDPPVLLMLSVDGLMPQHVFGADQLGLKIPNLRRLLQQGSYAHRVTSVLPALTYPCHATLVTGVHPDKHGITNNTLFEPDRRHRAAWYWFADAIKTPTLWQLAGDAGLVTANIDWPVSIGAKVRYNIAQYWHDSALLDPKFVRAVSTTGLVEEVERSVGFAYPAGDWSIQGDAKRLAVILHILKHKRPHFATAYFCALDTAQHYHGPRSTEAFKTLEQLDQLVGSLWNALRRLSDGRAILVLVSDHGLRRVDRTIRLNSALKEAGLIRVDEQGHLTAWDAYAWRGDGTTAVMLQNPADSKIRHKVGALLSRLASDPAHGIDQVLQPQQIKAQHGYPGAAFVVTANEGYMFTEDLDGPLIAKSKLKGVHGDLPTDPAMNAVFMVAGPGIAAGRNLGRIKMVDVAPTVAGLLGLSLPAADGKNVLR